MRLTIGRMPSYEPVDLSGVCNAGVDVLGKEPGEPPLGRVDLRGLPFLIGAEQPSAQRCFLLPEAPVSVPVGRLAPRVIIAHRLLEPGAPGRLRRRAGGRGLRVPPGRRCGRHRAGQGAVRDPGGAAGVGTPAVPRRRRPGGLQAAAVRGQVGRGRGAPGGARPGLAHRLRAVVLGEPRSGASDRTDRVHTARPALHHRRHHDQRPRRVPVRPLARAAGGAGGQGRAGRGPRHRRGPRGRHVPAAAARSRRPARLGREGGHVGVHDDRRAAVGHRRGPARQ